MRPPQRLALEGPGEVLVTVLSAVDAMVVEADSAEIVCRRII